MSMVEIVKEFWWAVLLTIFSMILVKTYWDQVKWWWMNTWYAFPLIGKLATLARDDTRSDNGWLKSEQALCADYAKFISVNSKKQFDNYNSYLEKSGDLGRKPLSLFMWILVAALVVVEAIGFSYVLAGYTIPGASEAMQSYGALGIAFLISVILVALTHYSGSEMYKNSKINEARQEWRDAGKPGQLTYKTEVSLDKSYEDDDKPHFTQMAHRVGKKPSYIVSILTLVFVVVVAVSATYVRGMVLEKELTNEVTGAQTSYFNAPKELADVASAAESKALQDTQDLDRHGGWGTFIVLAFIFVFLQILGVILGYKYGFAGKQSSAAYRGLGHGRFHTYDEVLSHVDEIIGVAQARLGDLQQRLEMHNSANGNQAVNTQKTFRDYLLEVAQEKHENSVQHQAIGQKPAVPVVTESFVKNSVSTSKPISQPVVQDDDELEKLKAELAKQQEIAELKRQLASLKGESV